MVCIMVTQKPMNAGESPLHIHKPSPQSSNSPFPAQPSFCLPASSKEDQIGKIRLPPCLAPLPARVRPRLTLCPQSKYAYTRLVSSQAQRSHPQYWLQPQSASGGLSDCCGRCQLRAGITIVLSSCVWEYFRM